MSDVQTDLFRSFWKRKGMVHAGDPDTSHKAAERVQECRTKLHQLILEAIRFWGSLTDSELERLPEFKAYGPSTVRKRRSELYQAKRLEICGERKNERGFAMKVWRIAK